MLSNRELDKALKVKNDEFYTPLSVIEKWNPEQFEIIGLLKHNCKKDDYFPGNVIINGKVLFLRLLIKKR